MRRGHSLDVDVCGRNDGMVPFVGKWKQGEMGIECETQWNQVADTKQDAQVNLSGNKLLLLILAMFVVPEA